LSYQSSESSLGGHRVLLDAYRAVAAYGVAVAHFWAQQGSSAGEFWAAFFVELFFPLSGFVLAPQLMRVAKDAGSLPIFYLRRWLRTLPPYWIALVLAALPAAGATIGDFLLYAFFLQDAGFLAPARAFYPVAWSLAVEEWFYLLFPAWIYLGGRWGLRPVAAALLFCACIQALRLGAAGTGHGETLRTLTWWRLDAIAMGFLLWHGRGLRPAPRVSVLLGILVGLAAAALAVLAWVEILGGWEKWGFIQAAMIGSGAILWFSFRREPARCPAKLSWICIWGGKVSYPIYLFHLFFLPWTGKLAGGIWIYLGVLTGFCAAFHLLVEDPILRRRPRYRLEPA
jgi:peptidoglycan/LPS O-acetylase OafA/YrhL